MKPNSAALLLACLAQIVYGQKSVEQFRSTEFAFGSMYIQGFPQSIEFYRALWGAGPPCEEFTMVRPEDRFGCSAPHKVAQSADETNKVLWIVDRGVCSFFDKASIAAAAGAKGLLVINDRAGLFRMPSGQSDSGDTSNLFIAMIKQSSAALFIDRLKSKHPVRLYSDNEGCFDSQLQTRAQGAVRPVSTSTVVIHTKFGMATEAALATFGSMLEFDATWQAAVLLNSTLCNADTRWTSNMQSRCVPGSCFAPKATF